MSEMSEALINDQYPNDNEPKGIGGWLIVIVVGYILSSLSTMSMISDIYKLHIDGTIAMLSDKDAEYYNPKFVFLLNFELIINILLVLFIVVSMVYLFKKKRLYPRLAITLIVASNIVVGLDILFCYIVGIDVVGLEIAKDIARMFFAILWILYFIKSRRVKNTFVN